MLTDLLLRIALAGFLGGLIGIERQLRAKEAGLRTHVLIGMGSALFMIVSKYGFSDVLATAQVGLDPSRIAAQVVTGVGFLGAGNIIIDRQRVKGLTTAADIWVTAAIGLVIGSGMYDIGIYGALLTLVVLEFFRLLKSRYLPVSSLLTIQARGECVADLLLFLQSEGIRAELKGLRRSAEDENLRVMLITLALRPSVDKTELYSKLMAIPGVASLEAG